MEKIKIAVVGISRRGRDIANNLVAASDFHLEAVCDIEPQRLHEAENLYPDARKIDDFEKILKDDSINTVAIATPQFNHRDLAVKAFNRGKHVYCEKPLAMTLRECDDMIEAAENSDRVFIVGQQMRYHYFLQKMFQLISNGEIGKTTMLWLREFRGPFRVSPEHMWIFDKERSGGMLVEKSCHHFDLFNWFAQSVPVRVFACGGQDCKENISGFESNIMDNAWGTVEYENGVKAMLGLCMHLGKNSPDEGKIGIHSREIGAAGTGGSIITGSEFENNLELRSSDSHNVTRFELDTAGVVPNKFNQYGNTGILMDFGECIREGKKPFADGLAGKHALAVSLAAEISAAEKRVVEMDEVYKLSEPELLNV